VARVADEDAFALERPGEHRVDGPPESGDFVVGLLGNSSRTPGSPAPPGSICAAWPRQCSTGLQGGPGERVADDRGGDECAGASAAELDGQIEQRFVAGDRN
jgi:hypothetical protein